jgi:hypothetical protein
MSNTTPRRFTLQDVMILVAVTAFAIAVARVAWEATIRAFQGDSRNQERAIPDAFGWFALIESVGLIPLFLRRPRPPLRRVARQPGMVASVAVASTFGVLAANELAVAVGAWLLSRPNFLQLHHVLWHLGSPIVIGPAVATCWLSLVLTWGWRPESNWPDRLGRFWGVVWVALFFGVELLRAFRY